MHHVVNFTFIKGCWPSMQAEQCNESLDSMKNRLTWHLVNHGVRIPAMEVAKINV